MRDANTIPRFIMYAGGLFVLVLVLLIYDQNPVAGIGFGLGAVNGMAVVALAVHAKNNGW